MKRLLSILAFLASMSCSPNPLPNAKMDHASSESQFDYRYEVEQQDPLAGLILKHPTGARVPLGTPVELSVVVSPEFSGAKFQWWMNEKRIEGATLATYRIPNLGYDGVGVYTVTVSVEEGEMASSPAQVELDITLSNSGVCTCNLQQVIGPIRTTRLSDPNGKVVVSSGTKTYEDILSCSDSNQMGLQVNSLELTQLRSQSPDGYTGLLVLKTVPPKWSPGDEQTVTEIPVQITATKMESDYIRVETCEPIAPNNFPDLDDLTCKTNRNCGCPARSYREGSFSTQYIPALTDKQNYVSRWTSTSDDYVICSCTEGASVCKRWDLDWGPFPFPLR